MRQIKVLAVLFALLPGIAAAQQILPKNTVWGRLGITASGPAQAIPFATLFANAGLAAGPQACSSHNWFSSLLASGTLVCTQPSFADLTSTIAAAQLIPPTGSTLGGVQSIDCSGASQFVQKINTDGTETCATPAGGGNVNGPGTSTTRAVAVYSNTAGNVLLNTGVTISSGNDLAGVNSLAGSVISTKVQQQGGSNTATVVTPSIQQQHDSANKVAGLCNISGTTVTCPWLYNVSSVTRSSAGQYVINFSTAFASASYGCEGNSTGGGGTVQVLNFGLSSWIAGSISVTTTQATAFSATESLAFTFACQGRQ